METRVLPFSDEAIAEAARLILAGEPVAVATETVYGLAGDATNAEAVARIYEAKGRPGFNPLIVHIPDLGAAERIGVFDDASHELAEQHWPGPLTLVVPLRPDSGIASIVTAGLPTIGLRVPAHPAMQALLEGDRPAARRALRQCQRLDQPDPRRARSKEPRRPHPADHRQWSDRVRAEIDHRRRDRGSAAAASAGADRSRAQPWTRARRWRRPASSPATIRPAKPLRMNVESWRKRRISDRLRVDRRRCQPQPVGRPGCSRRSAFRPASPGGRVAQAAHRRCARAGHGLGAAINDRLSRAAAAP